MIINLDLGKNSYDILIERGALARVGEYLDLDRRVLIVTDTGVPKEYAETVAKAAKLPTVITVEQGEGSKSFSVLERICREMLKASFTRSDCVVAVGGGVVGDLSGFAAASYMRGIDFYNIPTTVLSQVDSSIGGKVAVNLDNVKNIVGAFYQPKKVIIDPEVLRTLPPRQIANGLAEAIKMACTSDRELFELLENESIAENIDTVIERSLCIKKNIVEQDEREAGLRKLLNFGHTVGHGIESDAELSGLYHGECVALGMLPMCDPSIRQRLVSVLKKAGLPTEYETDVERVMSALRHDKKVKGDGCITAVFVNEIGQGVLEEMPLETLESRVREALKK